MNNIQLNFLGNYVNTENNKQLDLFNDSKQSKEPNYGTVERFFTGINGSSVDKYRQYWDKIKPKDCSEVFRRWLFAFMSVHTSWESNVRGYNHIKNWWEWLSDEEKLREKLKESNVGLHNNRTRYITAFSKDFWSNRKDFEMGGNETWKSYRDRLMGRVLGLGPAKTSFSLEMCHPNDADVTCLDTHLFQVYGLDQTKDSRLYHKIEAHWVEMSKMWNVPAYIARCMYWDNKQGEQDSRYWSHVLE
jgi:thermostable 8-oxoguanine DNA glycosylase